MDEEYDAIILGTGLTECIISGLLSVSGKKVLHMDKNNYYGAASASMTPLADLFKHFNDNLDQPDKYGRGRDWNVDLVPKFIMAHGELTKLLIHTDVTRYLEFKQIEGSYVFKKGGNIYKVPASDKEALASSLMGIFEKRRFRNFLIWILAFDSNDKKTWENVNPEITTSSEVFKKFGLDQNTADFIGHAICLYTNDEYQHLPCREMIPRVKLYYESLSSYGKSPYLYPLYGLGELPQGFARLSAVYGGTYMLDKPGTPVFNQDGQIEGVQSGDEIAKTKVVVCAPEYALDRCKKHCQTIRAICILKHPIAKAGNSSSCQIIFPLNQTGRKHDIYLTCLSNENQVAAKDYYIAFASTTVETNNPEMELKPALDLLEPIEKKFVTVDDIYFPNDDGKESKLFISKSYDATSHFQSVCADIKDIYRNITGEDFDFSKVKSALNQEE